MPSGGTKFPGGIDSFPANHPYRELVDPIVAIETQLVTGPLHIAGASHIYSAAGVPTSITGATGDFYFRTDGGTTSHIYVCTGGTAWTGLV